MTPEIKHNFKFLYNDLNFFHNFANLNSNKIAKCVAENKITKAEKGGDG